MTHRYAQTSVEELTEFCREENASLDKDPRSVGACFELFRRAVVENCQAAWEAVYAQYRRQALRWAGGNSDDAEDVVHCAFEKFLSAVSPKTFARFAGIANVLAYLRRCVKSVYIDRWRLMEREQLALDSLGMEMASLSDSPEQAALDHIVNRQYTEHIYGRLKDERERRVVYLNLELGLKPSEIVHRHPTEFPTARDVYRVRDRVIHRLSEDPILQNLWLTDLEKRS
jgi:DNA-directed RNA polymerase specialized sigma24 family protein